MVSDLCRYEIVTNEKGLASIQKEWSDLAERTGASAFQSFDWIWAWWCGTKASQDLTLRIGLCWKNDELLAILPLAVRRQYGLVRVLEWAGQDITDYCDMLVSAYTQDDVCMEALWQAVLDIGGFDIINLKYISPEARAYRLLAKKLGSPHRQTRCLRLRRDWTNGDAWFSSLNKKARNNYTRGCRNLVEKGSVSMRDMVDDSAINAVIERLLQLKRDWLLAKNTKPSSLQNYIDQFSLLIRALHDAGKLRIFYIECNGNVIAGSINLVEGNSIMAYLTSYDPEYEKISPGTLVMVNYIKWAFDHGIDVVDFMRGDESFKFKFANHEIELHDFLMGTSLIGRSALFLYGIFRRLRGRYRILSGKDDSVV